MNSPLQTDNPVDQFFVMESSTSTHCPKVLLWHTSEWLMLFLTRHFHIRFDTLIFLFLSVFLSACMQNVSNPNQTNPPALDRTCARLRVKKDLLSVCWFNTAYCFRGTFIFTLLSCVWFFCFCSWCPGPRQSSLPAFGAMPSAALTDKSSQIKHSASHAHFKWDWMKAECSLWSAGLCVSSLVLFSMSFPCIGDAEEVASDPWFGFLESVWTWICLFGSL